MKLTNKLLVVFIFTVNIIFAQEWVKTEITDFASINFPVESELTETSREMVYTAEDEFAYYIVSVRKLNEQQSSRITQNDIPNLYQGVVQGTMDATNGEVVSMNDIRVQKLPVLELEYNVITNSNLPNQRFKRIFYINQFIISIDYWPLTNQKNITNEIKAKYFDSFKFNSNEIDNTSTTDAIVLNDTNGDEIAYNNGYEIGYFIGKIIFYLLLIAIVIGLIVLIRRLVKKKKNITNSETKNIIKPSTIICGKCDIENNYNSKYCKRCGFELKK